MALALTHRPSLTRSAHVCGHCCPERNGTVMIEGCVLEGIAHEFSLEGIVLRQASRHFQGSYELQGGLIIIYGGYTESGRRFVQSTVQFDGACPDDQRYARRLLLMAGVDSLHHGRNGVAHLLDIAPGDLYLRMAYDPSRSIITSSERYRHQQFGKILGERRRRVQQARRAAKAVKL